ncbi:hypothetical protein CRG98_018317 [Punica granatum]|uniref:Myosin motor domain-containing protein n=1 Tax=Punica granatum TaxID=22663 RepID=A0A2I0JYA7_PUNGR|nr:hypothetical protein CRG98_018317 [Punica granatum]
MAELDSRRAEALSDSAKVIQRQIRRHMARKKYNTMRKSSIHVQSMWRGKLACKLLEKMRKATAATKIQKYSRGYLAKIAYEKLKFAAIVLQTASRTIAARNDFIYRRQRRAAIMIQCCWRRHRDYAYFKQLKKTSKVLQCRLKGKFASSKAQRKFYKKLKGKEGSGRPISDLTPPPRSLASSVGAGNLDREPPTRSPRLIRGWGHQSVTPTPPPRSPMSSVGTGELDGGVEVAN